MKKRLAIVIAVEKYADTRIRTVKYAEADAEGFAKALEIGGSLDKVFLLSGKATKTTINSQVRQHVKPSELAILKHVWDANSDGRPASREPLPGSSN